VNLGWPPPLAPPAEFQARRQRPHVVRYTVPRAGHNKNVRTVHAMPVGATARPGRSQDAQPNGSELGNGSLEHMPKPSWPANDPLSDESFRAYPHPPTCTSNSPHRRCHRTGISTACPVGWEWARVGMRVGAGVHVLVGMGVGAAVGLGMGVVRVSVPLGRVGPALPLATQAAHAPTRYPPRAPSAPPRRPRHTVRPPRHWLTPTLNSN
jgi:hypothetical protein